MNWLAIDIGGANLKLADGCGFVSAVPFALWKAPQQLSSELHQLAADAPPARRLAITMTGELVDCFASKTEGVQHILAAVEEAFPDCEVWVYGVDGKFLTPTQACRQPLLVAASNWHALASFAAKLSPAKSALLIDVGSTTCDIIPLINGRPATNGLTDTTRIMAGELLYTGVERSPCCAIRPWATYRGTPCPLAQEWFATMKDVYVVLGSLPEDDTDCDTADGRSASHRNAIRRLGKLVCADELEFNDADALVLAQELADEQTKRLAASIDKVLRSDRFPLPPSQILLSGHGEFLALAALKLLQLDLPCLSLSQTWGPNVSRCAPAHALANLARENWP